MSGVHDELPGDVAGTATRLRADLAELPPSTGPDLAEVLRQGRRRVVRRRAAGLGAVTALALVVGVAGLGSGALQRSEGPPAAPQPETSATVEVRRQPVTELYRAGEEAITEVAQVVGRRPGPIRWAVDGTTVYGSVLVPVEPAEDASGMRHVPVSGFPEQGRAAEQLATTVSLGGEALWVTTSRVDGGLPLSADYCSWWMARDSMGVGTCEVTGTPDGGLLLRLDEGRTAVFVWEGGEVVVSGGEDWTDSSDRYAGTAGPDARPLEWDDLAGLATDPRLRWGS